MKCREGGLCHFCQSAEARAVRPVIFVEIEQNIRS
jgi:hypothetical protein